MPRETSVRTSTLSRTRSSARTTPVPGSDRPRSSQKARPSRKKGADIGRMNQVSRDDVLAAVQEYDRLGPEQFFSEHGYGPSRSYELIWKSANPTKPSSAPPTKSPPVSRWPQVTSREANLAPYGCSASWDLPSSLWNIGPNVAGRSGHRQISRAWTFRARRRFSAGIPTGGPGRTISETAKMPALSRFAR